MTKISLYMELVPGATDGVKLIRDSGKRYLMAIERNRTDPSFFHNFMEGKLVLDYKGQALDSIYCEGQKVYPVTIQFP